MQLRLGILGLVATAGLLAGCSGPAFESQRVFDEAKGTTPTGDAYHQALYSGYMEHATYEQEEMMNYTSADEPRAQRDGLRSWRDPGSGRCHRLRAAAGRQGRGADPGPQPAGRSAGRRRCRRTCPRPRPWRRPTMPAGSSSSTRTSSPSDIAYCRDGFYKNMAIVNDAVIPEAPELVSLQSDVFFDFDKYNLKPAAIAELDKVYPVMVADTTSQFLISGHTDTVGSAAYNQKLSERRAQVVADYLESKGVSADRMTVTGFGFTQLSVQTPPNTPNAENRRDGNPSPLSDASTYRIEGARPGGRAPFVCACPRRSQRRPDRSRARGRGSRRWLSASRCLWRDPGWPAAPTGRTLADRGKDRLGSLGQRGSIAAMPRRSDRRDSAWCSRRSRPSGRQLSRLHHARPEPAAHARTRLSGAAEAGTPKRKPGADGDVGARS